MAGNDGEFQRRRPRQARSRATYDSILEAAAQVLEREGAAGLNTNRVAERAGVSVGTLYQYFPDKDAILLAVAERALATPGAVRAQHRTLVEALMRAIETLLRGTAAARSGGRKRVRGAAKAGDDALRRIAAPAADLMTWLISPAAPAPRAVRRGL